MSSADGSQFFLHLFLSDKPLCPTWTMLPGPSLQYGMYGMWMEVDTDMHHQSSYTDTLNKLTGPI